MGKWILVLGRMSGCSRMNETRLKDDCFPTEGWMKSPAEG